MRGAACGRLRPPKHQKHYERSSRARCTGPYASLRNSWSRLPNLVIKNMQGSSLMPLQRPISSLPACDANGNLFQAKVSVVPMTKALAEQWHATSNPSSTATTHMKAQRTGKSERMSDGAGPRISNSWPSIITSLVCQVTPLRKARHCVW